MLGALPVLGGSPPVLGGSPLLSWAPLASMTKKAKEMPTSFNNVSLSDNKSEFSLHT